MAGNSIGAPEQLHDPEYKPRLSKVMPSGIPHMPAICSL